MDQETQEFTLPEACIVLHSGGQDSTTCLLIAREQFGLNNVYPLLFDYGQKHLVELKQAEAICKALGTNQPMLLSIEALDKLGGGALTNKDVAVGTASEHRGLGYHEARGLPSTVIPGRNMLFLGLAAAFGAGIGCYNLMTGGCLADYDGYPDCRPEFYLAAERALQLALDVDSVNIITPLVNKSKAETFAIALELGNLELVRTMTHTCYLGVRDEHEWGAGCGECPACDTRRKGWFEFKLLQEIS